MDRALWKKRNLTVYIHCVKRVDNGIKIMRVSKQPNSFHTFWVPQTELVEY